MSNLGSGGPPERVPSTPGNLDISREDIGRADRHELGGGTDTVVYATELDGRSQHIPLAVKIADPNGTMDATQFDRIVEEATTWEQLTADDESRSGEIERRDHIVDIVDWGKEPLPWLALEFMDGGSLRDVLDEGDGQLPLDQALWVGAKICEGILHAHRSDVVHRDIKPSNILFRKPARGWLFPKVGDWGLARGMLEADARRGLTPAYAAPEQFHTERYGQPGPETDIYQIGVLVYELVTGELPFDGPAPEIREAKTSEQVTPLSEIADVPAAVDEVFDTALETKKSARYEDIVYLRDEFGALFNRYHTGVSGPRPAIGTRAGDSHTEAGSAARTQRGPDSDGTAATDQPTTEELESDDGGEVTDDSSGSEGPERERSEMRSWDEYKEKLERRQRGFLYSVLPHSLRRLFYHELTAELDRAESRRDEVETEVEEEKTTARHLIWRDEDERLDAGGFSELSEETLDQVGEVDDTRARLDTLLDRHQSYLTADEQETATRLRDELADYEAYLHAKRRLDSRVRSIGEELDDVEERIDEVLTGGDLLAPDQEREFVRSLDAISQSLRRSRQQLDMDALTTQDRDRFKRLDERERAFRQLATQYNNDLVQQWYSERMDAAAGVREQTDTAVESYQSGGTECPGPPETYLNPLETQRDALNSMLDSRQTEFLSADQRTRMEELRDNLAATQRLFVAKLEIQRRLPELRGDIDAVGATVTQTLDWETYLSATDQDQLKQRLDELQSRVDDIRATEAFDRLTEADQTRVTTCHERLVDFETEVEAYNPMLVEQHCERHSDAARRVLARIQATIERYRREADPLPESAEIYITRFDQTIQALESFLEHPQVEHLSSEDQNHLRRLGDELREERTHVERKAEFDSCLDGIRYEIEYLRATVEEHLDMETYLRESERQRLDDQLSELRGRLDELREILGSDQLTEAEQTEIADCRKRLDEIEADIEAYNPTLVEQHYERHSEAASRILARIQATIERSRQEAEPLAEPVATYTTRLDQTTQALESLLEHPQATHLSGDHYDQLEELGDELREARTSVERKAEFDGRLDEISADIKSLQTTVEGRLDMETYLSESERQQLDEQNSKLRRRLDELPDTVRFDHLTEAEQAEIANRNELIDNIERDIEAYNPTLVEYRYERHHEAAVRILERLRETLDPCKQDAAQLPESADAYTTRLDRVTEAVTAFLDHPHAGHLTETQYANLEEFCTELSEECAYTEAKAEFDTLSEQARSALEKLEIAVDQHLDNETYLTALERNTLREHVGNVENPLDEITDKQLPQTVSKADVERFDTHRSELDEFETAVETYNERFVEQECETLDHLGPDEKSLNEKQRRAVVRDERHNRVIAGPGTGKTFSLLCRIAYLVRRGVPPGEILALSFNKHISDELEDRLNDQFNISGVDTRTLHSYGMKLVKQAYPDEVLLVGQARLREVGDILHELRKADNEIATQYGAFCNMFEGEHVSADCQARKKFYNSRILKKVKTLQGEKLEPSDTASKTAHRTIANTLFEHEIEYRYKKYAPWANPNDGDAYIPDFTLSKHGICIEYIPSEQVQAERKRYNRKRPAGILRQFYEGTDRSLITLYGADISSSSIDNHLKFKLGDAGVSVGDPLSKQEKIDEMHEHNFLWRDIEARVAEFVEKAKTNQIEPSAHLAELDEEEDPLLYHFSHVATAVLEEYRQRYETYDAYDYADIVSRAKVILERGHADESMAYQHVLVDEFQDLNLGQIDLLRAILEHSDDAHLFAVGDDWQSIYGFRGARPEFFVDFEERFAPAATTDLELNYRCPPSVVAASNALMTESDIETDKSLKSALSTDTTPTVHVVPGDEYCYETNAVTRATELVLGSICEENRHPGEILVLARNEENSPFVPRITSELQEHDVSTDGCNSVTVTTAHGAKGREAEHVIVVNAVRERDDGFPPVEQEGELTSLVDATEESHIAEERRLFYMALTRAKERLDIQTRANWQSPFLDPLEEHVQYEHVPIDCARDHVSVTGTVDSEYRQSARKRQVGTLEVDGYLLSYAIPNGAVDTPLLQTEQTYRIENAEIGEYNGNPQLRIDDEATVERTADSADQMTRSVETAAVTHGTTRTDGEHASDGTDQTPDADDSQNSVQCPLEDCDYTGKPSSVAAHITGKRDEEHDWSTLPYASASEFKRTHQ